jgi:RNA polymerase sigma-70 factor (ECF subfamily)
MTTHLANEMTLVDAAKRGDDRAFAVLANQYYRNIYRLALRITGNREDAEDSSQEAMLKAYRKMRVFQGKSRFYTWLVRIVMNEALMKLRRRHSGKMVSLDEVLFLDPDVCLPREIDDGRQDPEEYYANLELRETLLSALEALGPKLSSAFKLRSLDDLTVQETADALGLSKAAAKSRLTRARRRLRRRLRNIHNRRESRPS